MTVDWRRDADIGPKPDSIISDRFAFDKSLTVSHNTEMAIDATKTHKCNHRATGTTTFAAVMQRSCPSLPLTQVLNIIRIEMTRRVSKNTRK